MTCPPESAPYSQTVCGGLPAVRDCQNRGRHKTTLRRNWKHPDLRTRLARHVPSFNSVKLTRFYGNSLLKKIYTIYCTKIILKKPPNQVIQAKIIFVGAYLIINKNHTTLTRFYMTWFYNYGVYKLLINLCIIYTCNCKNRRCVLNEYMS